MAVRVEISMNEDMLITDDYNERNNVGQIG